MSIGLGGFVKLVRDVSIDKQIELAYVIEKNSVLNKLGCKLGGNVSREIYDLCERYLDENIILFELMGSPLDNYIDDLLQPFIAEDSCKSEEEFSEELYKQLKINLGKIYNLLKVVLDYKIVDTVHIYINYLWYEGEELQDINIDEFCKMVFKEYVDNDFNAPVMSLSIKIGK